MDYLDVSGPTAAAAVLPDQRQPAVLPRRDPQIQVDSVPASIGAGDSVSVTAKLTNRLPGAPALGGAGTSLQFAGGINNSVFGPLDPTFNDVATGNTDGSGSVTLSAKPDRSGTLRFNFPRFNDLSPTSVDVGSTRVRASVDLQSVSVTSSGVRLQGRLAPSSGRRSATLGIVAQANGITPTTVQTVNLPTSSDTFDTTVALGAGTWSLKAAYSDPTAVEGAESRSIKDVTVPAALVPPAAITPATSIARALGPARALRRRGSRLTLDGRAEPGGQRATGPASRSSAEEGRARYGGQGPPPSKKRPRGIKRVATKKLRNGATEVLRSASHCDEGNGGSRRAIGTPGSSGPPILGHAQFRCDSHRLTASCEQAAHAAGVCRLGAGAKTSPCSRCGSPPTAPASTYGRRARILRRRCRGRHGRRERLASRSGDGAL